MRAGIFFLDHLLALLQEPFHAGAMFAAGRFVEALEDGFQPANLFFGDVQVVLQGCLQILVLGRLDHLRQGLGDLALRIQDVLKLVDE
jgi:hypothetical protein